MEGAPSIINYDEPLLPQISPALAQRGFESYVRAEEAAGHTGDRTSVARDAGPRLIGILKTLDQDMADFMIMRFGMDRGQQRSYQEMIEVIRYSATHWDERELLDEVDLTEAMMIDIESAAMAQMIERSRGFLWK